MSVTRYIFEFQEWRRRLFVRGVSVHSVLLLVFVFPLVCTTPGQASASYDTSYATSYTTSHMDEVLAYAKMKNIHAQRYWHVLLHYRKVTGGVKSIVDDPKFFLAPDGRTNPEAELAATIRAFFEPHDDEKDSAVCRFVARFDWLKTELDLDVSLLPIEGCATFDRFMAENEPTSASLVFPAAHINSPASMFGHTLLTIETRDKTNLLAYAISYAAETDESFGPFFAIKGLFGMYKGYFSILPYYAKLQQYSDVDHRDIWEYRLNLTEAEIRRLMLHVREWEHIGCRYYFFTKNCSYKLFLLLEAARPSLSLTAPRYNWIIPLDSIRIIKENGLIDGDAAYRPSRTTKINHLLRHAPGDGKEIAFAMARGDETAISLEMFDNTGFSGHEKKLVCELASEYVQYRYTKRIITLEEYRKRYLAILGIRSQLGMSDADGLYRIDTPYQPDRGHRSTRFALGGGVSGSRGFAEIRLRPAYHHLMEYSAGYIPGSQIVFADTVVRFYPGERSFKLERFDFLDIVSISPRNRFFSPLSWKIQTGLMRILDEDGGRSLVFNLNPGSGFAYGIGDSALGYVFLETGLMLGDPLDRKHAAGIGGSAGLLLETHPSWKTHVYVRHLYYGIGERFNQFQAGIEKNFAITPNYAISADISRRKERGAYLTEVSARFNLFF